MHFRASFCHPLQSDIIELGDIPEDKVIETFKTTDWKDYLLKYQAAASDPFYSPSLEIENKDNKNGLTFSAVGEPDGFCFYIFYKRPKKVKIFFGLSEKTDDNYLTDITDQSEQDALDCLFNKLTSFS